MACLDYVSEDLRCLRGIPVTPGSAASSVRKNMTDVLWSYGRNLRQRARIWYGRNH